MRVLNGKFLGNLRLFQSFLANKSSLRVLNAKFFRQFKTLSMPVLFGGISLQPLCNYRAKNLTPYRQKISETTISLKY